MLHDPCAQRCEAQTPNARRKQRYAAPCVARQFAACCLQCWARGLRDYRDYRTCTCSAGHALAGSCSTAFTHAEYNMQLYLHNRAQIPAMLRWNFWNQHGERGALPCMQGHGMHPCSKVWDSRKGRVTALSAPPRPLAPAPSPAPSASASASPEPTQASRWHPAAPAAAAWPRGSAADASAAPPQQQR